MEMKPRLPKFEEVFIVGFIVVMGLLIYSSIMYPELIIHPMPYEFMDSPIFYRDPLLEIEPLLSYEGVQYA